MIKFMANKTLWVPLPNSQDISEYTFVTSFGLLSEVEPTMQMEYVAGGMMVVVNRIKEGEVSRYYLLFLPETEHEKEHIQTVEPKIKIAHNPEKESEWTVEITIYLPMIEVK